VQQRLIEDSVLWSRTFFVSTEPAAAQHADT